MPSRVNRVICPVNQFEQKPVETASNKGARSRQMPASASLNSISPTLATDALTLADASLASHCESDVELVNESGARLAYFASHMSRYMPPEWLRQVAQYLQDPIPNIKVTRGV